MAETSLAQKYFEQLQEANRRIFELETGGHSARAVPDAEVAALREELNGAKEAEKSFRLTVGTLKQTCESGDKEIKELKAELIQAKTELARLTEKSRK